MHFLCSTSSPITATYRKARKHCRFKTQDMIPIARYRAGMTMLSLCKRPSNIHMKWNRRTLDLPSISKLLGKPLMKTTMRLREEEQSYFQKYRPIKSIGNFRLLRVPGAPLVERQDNHTQLSTHTGELEREDHVIHRSCLQHRQIRLFRLISWGVSDTRIEFRTASLDDLPDFVAISYVWGSNRVAKVWRSISGSRVPVTASLDSMLREHVSTLGQQWVWVDAL